MGRADIRPDAAMGYEACVKAEDWIKNVSSLQETFSCAADFNKSLCGSIGAVSYTHLFRHGQHQQEFKHF